MKQRDLEWGIHELKRVNPEQKYKTMLKSVAIVTKLLENEEIKPIVAGGFSVEIYTDEDYSTRDIDIITMD